MKKEITWFFFIVLIVNLALFALRIIGVVVFWSIIIIGALFAYKVLPRMKK
jgi:hypothetical protein